MWYNNNFADKQHFRIILIVNLSVEEYKCFTKHIQPLIKNPIMALGRDKLQDIWNCDHHYFDEKDRTMLFKYDINPSLLRKSNHNLSKSKLKQRNQVSSNHQLW